MIWVLLAAGGFYAIANLPLLYSLVKVHGWKDTGWLWGYAPNQFLFLAVVFPFATLYTFLALRVLVVRVRPLLPVTEPARFVLQNWSAWLVAGLAIVSVITLVVYFASAMSLDKLRPVYVSLARSAIEQMDDALAKVPETEREAKRSALIRFAQSVAKREQPPANDDEAAIGAWLANQEPEVTLQ